jgi:hypothetical protein
MNMEIIRNQPRKEKESYIPMSDKDIFLGNNKLSQKAILREQETIVYSIEDYTTSLSYAYDMMKQGYHVTTLVFTKKTPIKKTHDVLLMEGC